MFNLLEEVVTTLDFDGNESVFMQDFTFYDYNNNHILNVYRYNMEDMVDDATRTDRFSVSFFDYAEWYYNSFIESNRTNNPCNYERYFCSRNTGPAWIGCRKVASGNVGNSYSQEIGAVTCKVEKISNHMLKYIEYDHGLQVPLNHGTGCLYWEFSYDKFGN